MRLPEYRGPFKVSFIDIETNPEPLANGALAEHGLLIRIYYPTESTKKHSTSWLPQKLIYAKGYGSFLRLSAFTSCVLLLPLFGFVKMPVGHQLPLSKASGKLPIILFSHGLAGMRTTYSNICGNLASHGFIVVVPEHGDGSACVTTRCGASKLIPHHHPVKSEMFENETIHEYGLRFRRGQLNHRKEELALAWKAMKDIDNGCHEKLINYSIKHLSKSGRVSPGGKHPMQDFLSTFQGRIDFDKAVAVGHSFGAASLIHTLQEPILKFKCAILMDPWMHAVLPESFISIPTLHVESHVIISTDMQAISLVGESREDQKEKFNMKIKCINSRKNG